ncbi:MAG: hypothetical protein HY897_14065 [Deltaproteobacteria bacterium]|nr:hypothetical protein [Deltaproteobacteria bacterium]
MSATGCDDTSRRDAGERYAGFDAGDAGRSDSGTDAGTADDGSQDAATDGGEDTGTDAAVDAGTDAEGRDASAQDSTDLSDLSDASEDVTDAGDEDTGDGGGDLGTDAGDAGSIDVGMNPTSKNSWRVLPSANGFGAMLFDGDPARAKLTTYYPHIYRRFAEGAEETPNLAYDMYFGVRADGANVWLNNVPVRSMRYLPGTGIVEVSREHAGLAVTEYYYMTMLTASPVAVAGIRLKNTTGGPVPGVSTFALGNFRVGTGAEHTKDEKADYDPAFSGFFERNAYLASYYNVVFVSGAPPDAVAATTNDYNPWQVVSSGGTLSDHPSSQRDDLALFFQKDFGDLAAGAESTYLVAWNTIKDSDRGPIAAPISALVAGKTLDALLADEIGAWTDWHAGASLPGSITPDERTLAEQSAAFIKMAQVREEHGGKGQILASLPPGGWNIAWVRDMSYAIAGLARTGHAAEARVALAFLFERAQTGAYADPEWGIGKPYRISVVRYQGGGGEESDWNTAGPNIEYDGFGLSLWALEEYVRASGDKAFITARAQAIFDETADVLLSLPDPSGLIKPDSSIWEYHWDDDGYNGRRHFAFTSITAWRGLLAAEYLAGQVGRSGAGYAAAAAALKTAITSNLVDGGGVLVNFPASDRSPKPPESGANDWNIDASVVEAFNFGLLEADSPLADTTLAAFDRELGGLASGSPGFKRTNKRCPANFGGCVERGGVWSNDYDIKEWVFVDFRVLSFLRRRPDAVSQARAARLYDWVAAQTAANYSQIAELYDETTAEYRGSVPMCGFGPGALLLDLTGR